MKIFLRVFTPVSFAITIAVNFFGSTGYFGEGSVGEISARYQNLFTPADYAFSIWALIYLLLLCFVAYVVQKPNDGTIDEVGGWFIVSCAANICWILAWVNDELLLSLILLALLFISLMKIVIRTKMELYNPPLRKFAFVWWPFCIYSGWVSVAFMANAAAYLTKIGWSGFGLPEIFWALVLLITAGVIHIYMTWKRNMREFSIVGIWGLVAIAVNNWGEVHSVAITALLVSILIFISTAAHGYRNRKELPW